MTSYNPASPDFPFTIGIEEEYQVVDPQTRDAFVHYADS
jgi:carboxylate-amine ligase